MPSRLNACHIYNTLMQSLTCKFHQNIIHCNIFILTCFSNMKYKLRTLKIHNVNYDEYYMKIAKIMDL